jgi:predicted DsbA family dithiol-disulfide isomerase
MTVSARFYFDYVDPLSYLLEREIRALESGDDGPRITVERVGLELRTPPAPLIDPGDPAWADRWQEAAELGPALGVHLAVPPLVPWSRKAHELLLHAGALERADDVRRVTFAAFFESGRDIGRIDVLVGLAVEQGLDATEAKAVLDVDRYAADVERARRDALDVGLRAIPTLQMEGRRLEGFHNRDEIRTFLLPAP